MTKEENIKAILNAHFVGFKDEIIDSATNTICELEQEPETGHLILLDECANSGYYCSKCRKKVVKEGWSNTVKKIKYCPNCGIEMVGVRNEH